MLQVIFNLSDARYMRVMYDVYYLPFLYYRFPSCLSVSAISSDVCKVLFTLVVIKVWLHNQQFDRTVVCEVDTVVSVSTYSILANIAPTVLEARPWCSLVGCRSLLIDYSTTTNFKKRWKKDIIMPMRYLSCADLICTGTTTAGFSAQQSLQSKTSCVSIRRRRY